MYISRDQAHPVTFLWSISKLAALRDEAAAPKYAYVYKLCLIQRKIPNKGLPVRNLNDL